MSKTRPSISPDPQRRVAEQAFRDGQRAEQEWREAREAQRFAADSLDRTAYSHQRTAKAYQKAAERSDGHRDEFLEAAARHRGFAQQDRHMAQQLRQMAESDWTGNPAPTFEPSLTTRASVKH